MDSNKVQLKKILKSLSLKYNMPVAEIEELVNSPYLFTHEKLKEIDIDSVNSEDEANLLKTNFNYMALGKLYLSWPSLKLRKKRIENASKINKKYE